MTTVECQPPVDGGNVRLNASGNPVKSVAESLSAAARIIRSQPKRVALGEFDTPDLARLVSIRTTVDRAIDEAVCRLRDELELSWADIGRELGMTRQAAQQRYGRERS